MESNGSSQTTTLHNNPFAILGASLENTRAEINELAESKAFIVDDNTIQNARRTLLNPIARLSAEVSWLPGVSEPDIQQILTGLQSNSQIDIPTKIPAVAEANILATLLQKWIGQHTSSSWTTETLARFIQRVDEIQLGSLQELLDVSRSIAGLQPVDQAELIEAIARQRAYYLEVSRLVMSRMAIPEQSLFLTGLLKQNDEVGEFLTAVVDEYAFRIASELESTTSEFRSASEKMSWMQKIQSPQLSSLIRLIERFGQRVQPILLSYEQQGRKHDATIEFFSTVRGFILQIANEKHQYIVAKSLETSLQAAVGIAGFTHEVFARDMPTLTDMADQEAAYNQRIRETAVTPQSTPTPRYVPPPQSRSFWSYIPLWIKVFGVLGIIGWIGGLGDSNHGTKSTQAPIPAQCRNISSWWDHSDKNWEKMNDLLSSPSTDVENFKLQMLLITNDQRLSNPPAAAEDYNTALINYYQFMHDTVGTTSMSKNDWNVEEDRLFAEIQDAERKTASDCNIVLIDPTSTP